MNNLFTQLWQDDAGVVVSAELVFILTLLVIGLLVGWSQVQHSVVSELDDVGQAIGKLNQSYTTSGFTSVKKYSGGIKAAVAGSAFKDSQDECDCDCTGTSALGCAMPIEECGMLYMGGGGAD